MKTFWLKYGYWLLLLSLLLVIASPIWIVVTGNVNFWTNILLMVTIASGVSVLYSHQNNLLSLQVLFGVFVVFLGVLRMLISLPAEVEGIIISLQAFNFVALAFFLLQLVVQTSEVETETLVNSVSGYILIGISWAIVVTLWNSFFPGSFNFKSELFGRISNEMYFAFVTMTTLGYGDLLPIAKAAKSLSILIAISGSFYSTIVLAIIVGKFISGNQKVIKK